MDQPFAHTLSFDDLEVLVLVEDGGATPREVADSLGMDLEEAKALFADLVRRGLLVGKDESTTFQLTPLARVLRNDEAFRAAAFAAALTGAGSNGAPHP
jgi:DNA-binding IclR family transcriptional regulator